MRVLFLGEIFDCSNGENNVNSSELAAAITAISVAIADGKSAQEVEFLSNAVVQIAYTLKTIAAFRALEESDIYID